MKPLIHKERYLNIAFVDQKNHITMSDDNEQTWAPGYSHQRQQQYARYLSQLRQDFIAYWKQKSLSNGIPNDFEKGRVLGTGAFGVVFLAKHIESGKYYAMKMMEKENIIKQKQLEHSYYEKKILCGLNFPFLVYMKFFFKDNVYLYFVLPFVAGGEMFSHLRKMGKFDEATARFYAAQVVLAIEYLHACDLVYRDLKPENILIDKSGYIKITDFGFCKILHDRTWTLCGTPEYLAPEIIMSKGYGKSVDWWSFGILTFEMSAGHPPFYSSDPMRIYEKIVGGKYKCPNHFTSPLVDILSHVLQIDSTKRYGNLKDGVYDLKNHKWFHEIDWDSVVNCRTHPPFKPKIRSAWDSTNFDIYEDVKLKESPVCLYEEQFQDF